MSALVHRARFAEAWAAERRRARLSWALGLGLMAAAIWGAAILGEVDLARLWDRLPRFGSYFGRMVPQLSVETFAADMARWYWNLGSWAAALWQTILIAVYATLFGAAGAYAFSFLAARNLAPSPWARFGARRALEVARTVPELVFAVLFVYAFGIGPLAGVLAIALHSFGALGKLFADVAENADPEQLRGVRATGASWAQIMVWGATPQVAPDYLGYALLRFEINVRAASVLGFVGAGGIGQELYGAIKQFNLTDASAIALMLIGAVVAVDAASTWARGRLIGADALSAR
ncbi:MAG: phosphonate ABC transporter, permease protein PhnE [Rubrimonas sp.]|uniref:phosphonate ABC transporter, permease protein PhnE n=1 Tax=Rubrimonas sp. TaxID=2036015 RepID=UPI002FDEE3D8